MTENLRNRNFKSRLEAHVILTRLATLRNCVTEFEFQALESLWEEIGLEPEHQMLMQMILIMDS